jgi:hypothetical protein
MKSQHCSGFHAMNIVTSAKIPTARITFRGLVVEGSEPTSPDGPHFYPWASLNPPHSRKGTFWSGVMDQGEANVQTPPRMFFRLQGIYKNWLARRAWRRAVQRDWQRHGSVHVIRQRDMLRHSALPGIVAIAAALAVWFALPPALKHPGWNSPFHPDLPDVRAYTQLYRISVVFFFALIFGPCLGIALWPVYHWLWPHVLYAAFDHRRIVAVLRNRQRVSAAWTDLVDFSRNRLVFKGRQVLRFRLLDHRTKLILREIQFAGSSFRSLTLRRYLLRVAWPTMRVPAVAAGIVLLAALLPAVRRDLVVFNAVYCFVLSGAVLMSVALDELGRAPRSMRQWRLVRWVQRRRRPRSRRDSRP